MVGRAASAGNGADWYCAVARAAWFRRHATFLMAD
jgi:hypothetical protein